MKKKDKIRFEILGDSIIDRVNRFGYFDKIRQLGYRHGFSYSDRNMSFDSTNSSAERDKVAENIRNFLELLSIKDDSEQVTIIPNFLERQGNIVFIGEQLPNFLANGIKISKIKDIPSLQSTYPQDHEINYPQVIDQQADAVITDLKNINLQILSRDCLTAIVIVKSNNISLLGLVHAGWRQVDGLSADRLVKTLVGTKVIKPQDIYFAIAPCLRKKHAVLEHLAGITNESLWMGFIKRKDNKYHIDFAGLFKKQLIDNNVPPQNILDCDIDTYDAQMEGGGHSARFQKEHDLSATRMMTTICT